jgi:hypothetical protein
LALRDLLARPPPVLGDDVHFVRHPSIARQDAVGRVDQKVALMRHDVLAARNPKHELPLRDRRTNARRGDAGLFPKLADRRLFEGLPVLEPSAGRSPIVITRQCAIPEDIAEQQQAVLPVEDQQSRGGSASHDRAIAAGASG